MTRQPAILARLVLAPAILCLLMAATNADGVRPVKGIDVIVKKSARGPAVAHAMTDADGKFSFPVLPRGSYILTLETPAAPTAGRTVQAGTAGPNASDVKVARVQVTGAAGGPVDAGWDFDQKRRVALDAAAASAPTAARSAAPAGIAVESDGEHPLGGICEATVVKSKSNMANN